MLSTRHAPVLLLILDGVGLAPDGPFNAVSQAHTPVLDWLMTLPTFCQLKAHGTAVGMPSDDDMGNSEVGHNTLGAGRVFDQGAALVETAIQTGQLPKSPAFQGAVDACMKGGTLHLIGLLSDGNVHAHIDHTLAFIGYAMAAHVPRLRCHVLLDGRDVAPRSAPRYVTQLEQVLADARAKGFDYAIASGGGRMAITMDRYQADWDMVKRGWDTHVRGLATPFRSALEAIEALYAAHPHESDQTLPPFTIVSDQGPIGRIVDGDVVILTNFRGDRMIELTQAFESPDFSAFDRVETPSVRLIGMMQYDGDLQLPTHFLVSPPQIDQPVATIMSQAGLHSFAISETQKYGHVTYFWNGNRSGMVDPIHETYIEIPSDRVPFDQAPDMQARAITAKVKTLIRRNRYRFGRVNFPNGDMVGHTGDLAATIQAIETVDQCVGELIAEMDQIGGITVVVADHGNADDMGKQIDGVVVPKTAHTLNPVPFAIVDGLRGSHYRLRSVPTPGLANVAATLLTLLGIPVPAAYAPSLIEETP